MAQAVMIVGTVVSMMATAYSTVQQKKSGREAEKRADAQAARQKAEAEEAKKRAEREHARTESLTRARALASGATGESQENYLEEMTGVHREEADWIKKAGASQASLTIAEGKAAKRQADVGAVMTAAEGVGTAANWYQQYRTTT